MATQLLRRTLHFIKHLSGEGGWHFYRHEKDVIEKALSIFSVDVACAVNNKIKEGIFVDRMLSGKICVIRYYGEKDSHLIKNKIFDDLLVKVRLVVGGSSDVANVIFYRGSLFSVEFKNPSSFYIKNDVEICSAMLGNPKDSYTEAIDRQEHGDI